MTPYYEDDQVRLFAGDCLDVLRELADNSIDSVVTDPPYGLGFMGQAWDSSAALASRPPSADPIDARYRNVFPRTGKGPAAVAFDGNAFQSWCLQWATECLRVLKPGGHMLAFGGTRTWHRLACAVEDAGFEIRDSIAWLYGSGFPKSLDVSKAIDRTQGVEREDKFGGMIDRRIGPTGNGKCDECGKWLVSGNPCRCPRPQDEPKSEAAKRWQGFGTALKPAFEPVVVARKPLQGTVAQSVQAWGTGALNIDATRISTSRDGDGSSRRDNSSCTCLLPEADQTSHTRSSSTAASSGASPVGRIDPHPSALEHGSHCPQSQDSPGGCLSSPCSCDARAQSTEVDGLASAQPPRDARGSDDRCATPIHSPKNQSNPCPNCTARNVETVAGRWPANVVLDGAAAAELDRQSGVLTSGANPTRRGSHTCRSSYGEFAGQAECVAHRGADSGGASRFFPTFRYTAKAATAERPTADGVSHPTVKPLELMRWLVRLVTPPGGVVLDPFAGSGTTGEAAIHEHKKAVLIEREPSYLPLIVARLSKPMEVGFDFEGIA